MLIFLFCSTSLAYSTEKMAALHDRLMWKYPADFRGRSLPLEEYIKASNPFDVHNYLHFFSSIAEADFSARLVEIARLEQGRKFSKRKIQLEMPRAARFSPYTPAKVDCAISSCELSFEQPLASNGYFANFRDSIWSDKLWKSQPGLRQDSQLFVVAMLESPENSREWAMRARDLKVDALVSYRTDSDAYHPFYGWASRKPSSSSFASSPVKQNVAYWMVSGCKRRRVNFVEKLAKFFPNSIHVYGNCKVENALNFEPPISRVAELANPIGAEKMLKKVADRYYFYLALENSRCKDYITEKVWRGLKFSHVPIVNSGLTSEDVVKRVPPRSILHLDDFESIDELGDYLQYLIDHPEKYGQYHEWRDHFEIINPEMNHSAEYFCAICDQVALKLDKGGVTDLSKYWFEGTCRV